MGPVGPPQAEAETARQARGYLLPQSVQRDISEWLLPSVLHGKQTYSPGPRSEASRYNQPFGTTDLSVNSGARDTLNLISENNMPTWVGTA